jgi:hypothetical protein
MVKEALFIKDPIKIILEKLHIKLKVIMAVSIKLQHQWMAK